MTQAFDTADDMRDLMRRDRLTCTWVTPSGDLDLDTLGDVLAFLQNTVANLAVITKDNDLENLKIIGFPSSKLFDTSPSTQPGQVPGNDCGRAREETTGGHSRSAHAPDILIVSGEDLRTQDIIEKFYGCKFILFDGARKTAGGRAAFQRLASEKRYSFVNMNLETDYALFMHRALKPTLPVHFFTIVLNGEPFIRYHEHMFQRLPFEWHWHIVEGVAQLTHDTAWSVATGGNVPQSFHANGRSIDGTSAYIDDIADRFPNNVTVYRKKPGHFWDGKIEMVRAPLANLNEDCLLWQLDSDELWNPRQIIAMRSAFLADPSRTAAWFWCNYYVGPQLGISTRNNYAQNPNQEWLRVWNYKPGMIWHAHEPPILLKAYHNAGNVQFRDMGRENPFSHAETESLGAVFDHLSYVLESQLAFKESYYGLKGALNQWRRLQETQHSAGDESGSLRDFLSWVTDDTQYRSVRALGWKPIAAYDQSAKCWTWNLR
ncbi:hypothetical protein MKK69_17460 [Methylobacterium sp. J-026]|uniref:hypothetical protein n=1 Tax=Methylobacterium sp. J-026 TaxID=2836624 RepID=UPI001FBA6161|nr:hypothetical protein [Methylobacterium sp. J-026]MCJ2135819.1 hypothetical protein [Methylobacterium sp. J-026]